MYCEEEMVSRTKTKVASLVLTLIVSCLLLLPIDVSTVGIRQGCTLWQRLCYPFLHASLLHAGINCWCLLSISFGSNIPLWKLVVAYLIAVSYPSILMGSQSTVGLSGLVFALLGTICVTSRKWYVNISIILGIICFGFLLPHINATLHLYCYLAGLLVGLLTKPVSWRR